MRSSVDGHEQEKENAAARCALLEKTLSSLQVEVEKFRMLSEGLGEVEI